MGSACSSNVVENEPKPKQKKSTSSSTNLRYLKRDDADEILVKAPLGYYVFSYDAAGEEFLSVSAGAYVCHHPILRQGVLYVLGGEFFVSSNQFLDFYRSNPLGSVKLTKQFTEHSTPTKKMSTHSQNNHNNHSTNQHRQRISNDHSSTISQAKTTRSSLVIHSSSTTNDQNGKANNKENLVKKKSRKVSFKDYPPPAMDSSRENLQQQTQPQLNGRGNLREMTVPEHPSNMSISEVSSAGDQEHFLADEPIPVLPAPSGVRPPPLFQRFSMLAAEFSEPYDSSASQLPDLKQLLFQLYKGNPRLKYTQRVSTVKLIAVGEVDMYEERSYFLVQQFKKLKHWAQDNDFTLEYIDKMVDHEKETMENDCSTLHQRIAMEIDQEIRYCVRQQIPFILMVFKGHHDGHISIPQSFTEEHFMMLLRLLSNKECEIVKQCYIEDQNTIPCSYHLATTSQKENENIIKSLSTIFENVLKEDDLNRCLVEYFVPARARHIRSVLQSTNPFVLFVERTFYDCAQYQNHPRFVSHDNTSSPSNHSQIKQKTKEFYEDLLLNNNLDEDEQFVTMETSFSYYLDDASISNHCQSFSNLVTDRLRSCITSIQHRLKAKTVSDLDYDEVLFHVLRSSQIMFDSTVDEESYQALKEYIQGIETSILLVSGPELSGKSSLLSRGQTLAFDWFNGLCCIVYRQIGQTIDSTSSSLLLRSICLQLSYAYGTDPNAIPNDNQLIWDHFLRLMELATDSLPLVIILDGFDKIKAFAGHHDLSSIVSKNELPPFVKVIVSVDDSTLKDMNTENAKILQLLKFNEERAFQYLDHMLVEKDRTLNALQKDLVSNVISTNNNPVFIRMLMSEIETWKSSEKVEVPFTNIEDGYDKLCQAAKDANIDQANLDSFFYSLSLDIIGIPKLILRIFLEMVHTEKEQFEIQSIIDRMLDTFKCICHRKFISGLEIISLRDRSIIELVRSKVQQKNQHQSYFAIFKEVFLDYYQHINIMDETSVENQRLLLNQISFFHRLFIKYGSLADIKQLFVFNFDYLMAKLTCFSFAHLYNDIMEVSLKFPNDYELKILSEIIQLSREGLGVDSSQFPLQVIGRLDINLLTGDTTSLLKQLYQGTASLCHVLKPNHAFLISPQSLIENNNAQETQPEWKFKDLKIMFLNHPDYDFIGWSRDDKILYFDSNCQVGKSLSLEGLNKVIFAVGQYLVIETKLGVNIIFHTETKETLCSVHNDFDVVGTDHVSRLILMSTDMKQIKVLDLESRKTSWTYEPETTSFNNVCCSSNGKTVLCFSDNRRKTPTRRRFGSTLSDSSVSQSEEVLEDETYEEITVLDLLKSEKITTINLPTEASFSKFYLISEDGLYFVRITEPDMNILVWDLRNGDLVSTIETKCCRIVRLAVSSVGNVVVTVSADASLRVFNLNDGTLRHTLTECVKSVRMDGQHCLVLSPNGMFCVYFVRSNFQSSYISVWNLHNGGRLASLTTDFYGLTYQISNDSNYIVSNFPTGLVRFNLSD